VDSDRTVPRAAGSPEPELERSVELLAKAQAGDERAYDLLLARYLPRLRRWARGRLPRWARSGKDTEDLVQDAIVSALRHLGGFVPQHDGAIQAYLRQAVLHRIQDEIKAARRRPPATEFPSQPADPAASPFEAAVGTELLERYEAALARLSAEESQAVVLRVEFRLEYQAIAEALGKSSADAARMSVARALVRLAEEMGHGR
jgi:RNA polymerase sigma-70 factor (ECF subfamily)